MMLPKSNGNAVLLTGGTGFLGSRLLRMMLKEGFEVIVLKRSWSNPSRIADVLSDVWVYDMDHVDLFDVFTRHRPEFVIHAATCYGRNGESAEQIEEANFRFPLTLLELSEKSRVNTFFSFDTFFNTKTELPGRLSLYVSSKKRFAEQAMKSVSERGVRFVNLRLEHMYGPYDDEHKFVPFLIRSLLENRPVLDLTAGEQQRDFIYVDDVAGAVRVLLNRNDELPRPYVEAGVGSGAPCVLKCLVELVRQTCGSETQINLGTLPYRADEIMYSKADITLLKELGWMPEVSLLEGVRRTVAEMRARVGKPTNDC